MANSLYGLSPDNPLMSLLAKNYFPAQPEQPPDRGQVSGTSVFEIDSKLDIEYIEPDKSGKRQVFICDKENRIYLGRYNHVRKETDYRAYIDEGEVRLSQGNDTSEGISKIAEALVAVVSRLEAMQSGIDTMRGEITEIKDAGPKTIIKEIIKEPEKEPTQETKPAGARSRNSDGTFAPKAKGGKR